MIFYASEFVDYQIWDPTRYSVRNTSSLEAQEDIFLTIIIDTISYDFEKMDLSCIFEREHSDSCNIG